MRPAKEQMAALARGAVDLIDADDLERRIGSGRPLRVKTGFDPTSADLHLGHTVLFTKMRQFQDLGHTVIFLIGDFTAMIGDPSGQNATRPMVERETIERNAELFAEQAFKVLDRELTEVRRNSEWMGGMGADGLIRLAQGHTVARMLERRDFARRHRENRPIAVHEFLYPIVQGYDSVMLECDVELGGTDQLFNLTVGRTLQERAGQAPQVVLTMPLLPGIRGEEKMSKSSGNYVGIDEPAREMYAKLMSITDGRMWQYYELLSLEESGEVERRRKAASGGGPKAMEAKDALAFELAARYHGDGAAEDARQAFRAAFRDREVPDDLQEIAVAAPGGATALSAALKQAGLVPSLSQCRRLFSQGGIRIGDERVTEDRELKPGEAFVVRVGKRKGAKLTVTGGNRAEA